MRADLHVHSWYSDGEYSPETLARLCRERGLGCFSLTDHDTLRGTEEARRGAEREGIRFLSGVELSTHGAREIHILGYRTEGNARLARLCADIARMRRTRAERMTAGLRRHFDIPITMAEVEAECGKGDSVCRVHIARALLKKGRVSSVREAFSRYIGVDSPCFVKTHDLSPEEAVEAISEGGSLPVLAHPAQIGCGDGELREIVARLKDRGLAGIEARYSAHTTEETALFVGIAREFGLFVTVGSDFHGSYRSSELGTPACDLDDETAEILGIG